ncbi:cell growth regulator with RING finger domain protein 1 [Austrofundulus limnaeus]|uniref:Cell growth regulator with RING finger domain protein 1 n=1 Tax=Austrofundulus limnaeus TaxID=52670 RepID=A0A2I4BB55_AUSLI|nr:PREDICTED: cell growth regulator with RING finger domain protein 1 [Austrofundulus limnaeus]
MATVFLVTLYEYSPLFSIGAVSLCFIITAAILLGRFGFHVPAILHSSDEPESITPTPEKHMVQVTNPFALDLGSGPANVIDGVSLKPCCLDSCVLSCFWGCEVIALQRALQTHQHNLKLCSPQHFLQALQHHYHYCQTFQICEDHREEVRTRIPDEHHITDFGPLPRDRYPLVAVLTLAKEEARNIYNIVANVTVIHVPDDKYNLSARILFQYLLTSQRTMFELKPLFMSAGAEDTSPPPDPELVSRPSSLEENPEVAGDEWDEWSERSSRDCVICQNAAVNRVLLPCRHACVCDHCVTHFQHCPICRAFVLESFVLDRPAEP